MNKLFLVISLGLNIFSFGAATILSVIDEGKDSNPTSPTTDLKVDIPNTIGDDKHKKFRHYPLTRADKPKSFTTPGLQATVPGEIRYLHPAVSQEVNRTTLPEYRLEAQIRNRERCRKGCLCVIFTIWTVLTTGSVILLAKCNNS